MWVVRLGGGTAGLEKPYVKTKIDFDDYPISIGSMIFENADEIQHIVTKANLYDMLKNK